MLLSRYFLSSFSNVENGNAARLLLIERVKEYIAREGLEERVERRFGLYVRGHWTLDTGHWTGSPFIFSPSTESYAAWVHDINNDDDGVLKCRFTITVFLPPCNVRPVYLLPPSPFSPVSQNSHLPPHSAPLCLECGRVGRL